MRNVKHASCALFQNGPAGLREWKRRTQPHQLFCGPRSLTFCFNLTLVELTQPKFSEAQPGQKRFTFWDTGISANSFDLPFLIFIGFQLWLNNNLWSRLNLSLFYFWWHFHNEFELRSLLEKCLPRNNIKLHGINAMLFNYVNSSQDV